MSVDSNVLYEVKRNKKIGRYLVAGIPLLKGTCIFLDRPFAIGPKPDSPPVCLGCHKSWDGCYKCSRCGWPCCNSACEKFSVHRDYECEVFAENNVTFQNTRLYQPCLQFDCITPLRALLAKEKIPQRWLDEIDVMEDHNEERRLRPSWDVDEINIVDYLRGPCKLAKRFSESLIQHICGILEVNAVEVPLIHGPNIRAIYPKVAVMSHNCVPSIVHTIVPETKGGTGMHDYVARVWAARDLEKGEKLELCYTQVLQSTVERRDFLEVSKFFYCDCTRCSDPTELGTEMSTLVCTKCDSGYVRALNPVDIETLWACSHCNFETNNANVRELLKVINSEIAFTEKSRIGMKIDNTEQLISWLSNILHPNHAVLVRLRYDLLQLYGHDSGCELDTTSVSVLRRKAGLCEQVIKCLDVISPGQNRIKGMTLFELHNALIPLSQHEYKNGLINQVNLDEKLSKAKESIRDAGEILSREEEYSEKGVIGREALKLYQHYLKCDFKHENNVSSS